MRCCANDLHDQGVDRLGSLYDLTSERLVRYAVTVTRNMPDAEDAIQATMVRIAMKPKILATAQQPWAYLLRVTRNEALRILQKRKPFQIFAQCRQLWARDEEIVEENDQARVIRKALKRLPTNQSEVVVLKIWEDMTFAEIASVLDESPNTVASRYRYALQKLDNYLRPVTHEDINV
ncbi:MAG: sigma-70 family RNA polymerase sigma factor [Gimesia sp.]|uniref:Sigma-70 family RNA polymerase sigma factor n=1 Tax=Gimesia maris TaxID=122 RepID=A0A3D3R3B7_9PLAN|nr:sigma-70 family RNA polymerase sigma factor [Gimesia sp.]QGQ32868.1 sigma-70 family RNA polymerase sigma factor [Gimesia maris]HCO23305.1 sigma-70 family RNA polymerase sigma factor [Gimesia maris]